MKKFYLKNNQGEVINKIKANTLEQAIRTFSEIKKISKQQLLEIYDVANNETENKS
jgi:hypothetical protein